MPRCMPHHEVETRERYCFEIHDLPHIGGLGEVNAKLLQHAPRIRSHLRVWVRNAVTIRRMDERGDFVAVGHGKNGKHVIDVAVREEDCNGLKASLPNDIGNAWRGIHAGIDDDTFRAIALAQNPAIGAPRPRFERLEHGFTSESGVWCPRVMTTCRERGIHAERVAPRLLSVKRGALAFIALLACLLTGPAPAQAGVNCAATTAQPRKAATVVQPATRLKATIYKVVVHTNCGDIVIAADAKSAPITVRNIATLAAKKFFNQTLCHRVTTDQIFIVQCGDPTTSGSGGPGFAYTDENLPTAIKKNRYPAGTVAMANSGANTNGSQFFIVYRDGTFDLPASYTIWGHVTSGLDILKAVAAKGTVTGSADGWPAQALAVKSITVSEGTP